ncbi:MAG: hypothetical protein SH808_09275 [Saprospiraceae bacterium]|nr:hypothetical protein [Saprospiraceae bacterium]
MKLLRPAGFKAFESIYGFPVQQLEKKWTDFMKTIPIPVDFNMDQLKGGCG